MSPYENHSPDRVIRAPHAVVAQTNGFHRPPTELDLIAALHARIAELERRVDALTKPQPVAAFTERENDIMQALEAGYTSYQKIGKHLHIEPSTVGAHLAHMRAKAGVRTMGDLLAWRMRQKGIEG